MATTTDWNKHGAIAGYGGWVWAGINVAIMVWFGTRPQAPAATGTAALAGRGYTPMIPAWAFWLSPLIYGLFVLTAACLQFKAKRAGSEKATESESGQKKAEERTALYPGPDLRVDYKKSDGERPKLGFKIRSGPPATIRKVGPLVSEELYRAEHDFILLRSVHPEIEIGTPIDCEISGVRNVATGGSMSLESVLELGGPMASDSVVVEFSDADRRQFSKRFFLNKNNDGSIIWSVDESQLKAQDLSKLRGKVSLLKKATADLTNAGELLMLAEESASMEVKLLEILAINYNETLPHRKQIDLSLPMSRAIIFLETESEPLPWQRLSLMEFRSRYQAYQVHCDKRSLPKLPSLPNEMTADDFVAAIAKQRDAILKIANETVDRYAAAA